MSMEWRGGNHIVPADFRDDHLPEEHEMTSATPKPRAGEHAPSRFSEFGTMTAEAVCEILLARRDDLTRALNAEQAHVIALRERERELVEALEMMLDIDPVLQASSDYQVAKARAVLAKHGR